MLPIVIMEIADDSDRAFMSQVYEQYRKLMYAEAQKTLSPVDADDVVQDVLVKLIEKIDVLRTLQGKQLSVYIGTAVRHTAVDFVRRRNRESSNFWNQELADATLTDDSADLEEMLFREFNLAEFHRIWPQLDEDVRYIIESRYILHESDEEIAKHYNIRVDSVRMRVTRAKRKAAKALREVYINK